MSMSEEMMYAKALHAFKLSESQLPIVLSALETKANGQTIEALKDITIKMIETHRRRSDPSDVYQTNEPAAPKERRKTRRNRKKKS